jgi:hypothetical protein
MRVAGGGWRDKSKAKTRVDFIIKKGNSHSRVALDVFSRHAPPATRHRHELIDFYSYIYIYLKK